jgi:hypothetical protein
VTGHPFAFRAPWYVRERVGFGLRDPRALRPVLQKYDSTRFVKQVTTDPRDSLRFTKEDKWSYPVPVTFPAPGVGRQRFATSKLVRTNLRKLYQPNHDRFYLVLIELFCDTPGLPRAGSHTDVDVRFVLRRQKTAVNGNRPQMRKLARELLLDLLKKQHRGAEPTENSATVTGDIDDLWFADAAARERFVLDNGDLLSAVSAEVSEEGWLVDATTGKGRWAPLHERTATEEEETHPMWRLPDEAAGCDAAKSRSLWFGVVPTYSGEHWFPDPKGRPQPKLDEHAIYQIWTVVTEKPAPGREKCPPNRSYSDVPSEPFRLAAPYDPEGTRNHKISISAPDFRTLAAAAGQGPGSGGLAINTPPGSQMKFNPFNGIPKPGSGSMGNGGVCTFAFELFFIVALFLFLMFLPIVVFVFQLWWMLALRFCFPRLQLEMSALATFFGSAHGDILVDAKAQVSAELNAVFGVTVPPATAPNPPDPGIVESLQQAPDFKDKTVAGKVLKDLVLAVDPATVPKTKQLPAEHKPSDPLCPVP